MQVLTTQCPYCAQEVDTTIDQLGIPVVCPACNKPFEMEMPSAVVTSVHEVDENSPDNPHMAVPKGERDLAVVHPVILRARPFSTLALVILGGAALVLLVMSIAGQSLGGYALDESVAIGPASLLTWVCAAALLIVASVIGYWTLLSSFTTLTITDDRTIYQEGIIARETSEVQHDDVRNIQLDQSLIERLLNVGDIGISSSGQDDLEVVARRMPDPARLIKLIRENQD